MRFLRRDTVDDVDVDSCLANLHRLDDIAPARVLDLTRHDRSKVDLPEPDRVAHASVRGQPKPHAV